MNPVTRLTQLTGGILSSIQMVNSTPVIKLRFRPLPTLTRHDLSIFILVTGLECLYGKIFSPVTEISVAKTEILVTGLAHLFK